MAAMVDLHSHILSGLDDGAKTLAESVEMIRIAAQAGTTDLVATPHASFEFTFDPRRTEEKLAELAAASGAAVRLYYGCDFHLSFGNIQDALANPSKYAINHKNYLLVEFSDVVIIKSIQEVFSRLRDSGLTPIITHPERNFLLQRDPGRLRAWVDNGCLIQVTAQSLLGRFGPEARNFCGELMKRGLVHFVASDAHDPQERTPRLDQAYEHIAQRFGDARAQRLFVANPGAVLYGDPLPEEPTPEPAASRWWGRLWG